MNRWLPAGVIALLVMSSTAGASEQKLPAGVTCSMVQDYVKAYGRFAAFAWAKLNGYSNAEIREAGKCLGR